MNELMLFSGSGSPELTQKIADNLGVKVGDSLVKKFSDGEFRVQINESVRGDDVFIVQSMVTPVNEHLMELLITIDAFKRASARRINVVLPYYAYARQDRKVKPREPVTAKLVANLLSSAGASRLLTTDLHAGQIVAFFDIPIDNLYGGPIIAKYLAEKMDVSDDIVVVSPDVGGVARAQGLAEYLGAPMAIIVKRRPEPNKVEVVQIIGEVQGKRAIMIDDIIDTAGSIVNGANALMARGAKEVYAAATHAVLSGPAIDRLKESPITKLIVTDTLPLTREAKDSGKIEVVSIASLLANAINNIHYEKSVSNIFSKHWKGHN
ncbi:MAG: ribose-phosphate pyrophosphokinase [Abditibacteriota bacterium]|nr:ribose-phosphate pyrophosphokinase [Abditibacteriota bacterium]